MPDLVIVADSGFQISVCTMCVKYWISRLRPSNHNQVLRQLRTSMSSGRATPLATDCSQFSSESGISSPSSQGSSPMCFRSASAADSAECCERWFDSRLLLMQVYVGILLRRTRPITPPEPRSWRSGIGSPRAGVDWMVRCRRYVCSRINMKVRNGVYRHGIDRASPQSSVR